MVSLRKRRLRSPSSVMAVKKAHIRQLELDLERMQLELEVMMLELELENLERMEPQRALAQDQFPEMRQQLKAARKKAQIFVKPIPWYQNQVAGLEHRVCELEALVDH